MRKLAVVSLCAALVMAGPATGFQPGEAIPATGVVEYAFTPGADAAGLVTRTIGSARQAVYVQAFSFTHEGIARALVAAARRGVNVEVIADQSQTELIEHNVIPQLARGKVRVFIDAEHAAAHDKVMIVDPESSRPAVLTGSFNFTFAAQYRNAENVLVMRGNRELARAYFNNWRRHRAHATPFRPQADPDAINGER